MLMTNRRTSRHFARFALPGWVIVTVATGIAPAALAAAAPYTILDLGTLGGTDSYAYGINSSRQVVGEASNAGIGATHAFPTAPNSTITAASDLGTLVGRTNSSYPGLND